MKQKILYKFILVILGMAILSLTLVINKSQAANQVSVTAKVDPTLTLSLAKIKDSEGYKLTVVTNYFSGFVVSLSNKDSIIVPEKGGTVLDTQDLGGSIICASIY